MLSGVLTSPRAIKVNIEIMRAFIRLRQLLGTHKELARKLAELEQHLRHHDKQIQAIFDAIRQLMAAPEKQEENRLPASRKACSIWETMIGMLRVSN